MRFQSVLATLVADLADGQIGLTDVGTGAAIGGVLGETAVRLAPMFGVKLKLDGWREGMFFGALGALALAVSGQLGA